MKKYYIILVSILLILCNCGCTKPQSATNNNKLTQAQNSTITQSNDSTNTANESNNNTSSNSQTAAASSTSSREGYDCNIAKDKKTFNANKIDIKVGDSYYSTQINDWYSNFNKYEGKTVEIEGYYIVSDPYTFVGRFGPSCPYCSNGYVSFEFYTTEDLSALVSTSDWIKVKGILRQGEDSSGVFYYIEAISVEKGAVGKDTVKD